MTAVPLCNHIMPDGNTCGCPALRDQRFCHFHKEPAAHTGDELRSSQKESEQAIDFQAAVPSERLITRKRLYGLPCSRCGAYYFSDEPDCPVCARRQAKEIGTSQQMQEHAINFRAAETSIAQIKPRHLYGLPCPTCGACSFSNDPNCQVCGSRRVNSQQPGSMGTGEATDSGQAETYTAA